jgi:hypothetical protein
MVFSLTVRDLPIKGGIRDKNRTAIPLNKGSRGYSTKNANLRLRTNTKVTIYGALTPYYYGRGNLRGQHLRGGGNKNNPVLRINRCLNGINTVHRTQREINISSFKNVALSHFIPENRQLGFYAGRTACKIAGDANRPFGPNLKIQLRMNYSKRDFIGGIGI